VTLLVSAWGRRLCYNVKRTRVALHLRLKSRTAEDVNRSGQGLVLMTLCGPSWKEPADFLVRGACVVGRCAFGCTCHSVTTSFSALTPFRSRVSVFGMASSPWPVMKGAGAVW
jgi:hypothetical protein